MSDTPPIPVFDLGGVFVEWDPMLLFRKLFPSEEEAQWFYDNICTKDWNLEFDAGDSFAEGVARLTSRFASSPSPVPSTMANMTSARFPSSGLDAEDTRGAP